MFSDIWREIFRFLLNIQDLAKRPVIFRGASCGSDTALDCVVLIAVCVPFFVDAMVWNDEHCMFVNVADVKCIHPAISKAFNT